MITDILAVNTLGLFTCFLWMY